MSFKGDQMKNFAALTGAVFVSTVSSFTALPAIAQSAGEFYKGKSVTMIIASSPGGGYDTQGRLIARHIGRKLPSNPTIIVQNMPGAGGITAANHLYNVAPKDGTVFGLVQREALTANLISPENVRFEITKFNWIGNISSETGIVVAWETSPVKTLADLFKTEMIVGGTGPIIDTETTPRLMNALIGTKFKIISGYPGTSEILLAMQRGELHGLGDWSWSNIKARNMEMVKDGKILLLMQSALTKDPDLPNLPFILDYAKTPEDRRLMEFLLAPKAVARPVAAPPTVPADRVQALRDAFIGLKTDPEFVGDVTKSKLEVALSSGAEVERIIALIGTTPKAETDRLLKLISATK
jgi:tripartite-type tricarboxylate transporter receptor subunit TctC